MDFRCGTRIVDRPESRSLTDFTSCVWTRGELDSREVFGLEFWRRRIKSEPIMIEKCSIAAESANHFTAEAPSFFAARIRLECRMGIGSV
jgi:hypothetical protein